EEVEVFPPELEPLAFPEYEFFTEGPVYREQTRAADDVGPSVAQAAAGLRGAKGRWVVPVRTRLLRHAPVSNDVGPLAEVGIQGAVVAQDRRKRESGFQRCDATELPAGQGGLRDAPGSGAEGLSAAVG